jgi:LuxR family quorum sensing-dependent transcriptional regulator
MTDPSFPPIGAGSFLLHARAARNDPQITKVQTASMSVSDRLDFNSTSAALDRIKGSATVEDFKVTFAEIIGGVGYSYFIVSGIPEQTADLRKFLVVMNVPAAWEKAYFAENYLEVDPIARRCLEWEQPFFWADVVAGLDPESPSYRMMAEAASHGLTNGVCFPIHGINGYTAGVSLSGKEGPISAGDVRNLHLFCIYSFGVLKTLVKNSVISVPALTKREKEILVWTALGKTNREIGELLCVSDETVATHVKNIIKKLSAQNKAEAVAIALRAGIIPG